MEIKLIVAIIRRDRLEPVEEKLKQIGVERINVSKVKGYGEYRDFFARDWMVEEARLEIFTRKDEVETIQQRLWMPLIPACPAMESLLLFRSKSFF